MPVISIVLPVYNGQKYLRESIESVIGQSFIDWELIIVNDCSTDNTSLIIEEYIKKDTRIRVINNTTNQKLPTSLNIGFAEAKGLYFTWTSDDNIYHTDAIKRMYDFLENNNQFPMVVARMDYINETGNSYAESAEEFDNSFLLACNNVGACFLYRKSVYEKIGGYRREYFLAEDYEYWIRMQKKCGNFGFISEKLYWYRLHGESLSNRQEEVKSTVASIRNEYINYIVKHLSTRKDILVYLYRDMYRYGKDNSNSMQKIKKTVEELARCEDIKDKKDIPLIVYGAGYWGERAFHVYGDRVKFFSDKDKKKQNKYKNGIKIISPREAIDLQSNYGIIIAVGGEKYYSVLVELISQGLEKYILF